LDTKTYGFYNITNNSAANAATGQSQLAVQVYDYGTDLVSFKFSNTGLEDCVITEIYFQGDSILEFDSIDESLPGVDFNDDEVGNAKPGNLPGGKSMAQQFLSTTGFSIEPINPAPHWGVGPGEWVELVYSIQAGSVFEDIVQELDNADLRIGIHVQSFDNGGSESFVNVPEPATMILLTLSGLFLGKCRRS
jgi:hypothetical protein